MVELKKIRLPKSAFGRTALSLILTLMIGFGFFYLSLPALHFQNDEFYGFLAFLCIVYIVCTFLLSGIPQDNVVRTAGEKLKDWFQFVKKRCLPAGILLAFALIVPVFGEVFSMPIFHAGSYRDLLDAGKIRLGDEVNFSVPTGNFGDILAGYLAKKLGLPVGKLICASNANNVPTQPYRYRRRWR